jgi:signal transduction histidine kinase
MKISSQYINLPLNKIDDAIQEALQSIGEFVNASRSYIFSYNFKEQTTSNTFEWCSENIASEIDNLQNVPIEAITDWVETHRAGKIMHITDVLSLPEGSALRGILEPQGIYSLLTLPMMSGDQCLGFVGFDWVGEYHSISETEHSLLALFAQLLVNINNRREADMKLNIEKQNVEKSNKALSEFAYIASHDLREPLRKITAFGTLLNNSLAQKLTEDEAENLSFMIDGAKRMQQMVDDLLHYSQISKKSKVYSFINLDELLREIISFDLSEMINQNNTKIIIENEFGELKGERTQIKQLFQNIISNGIKYRKPDEDPVIKLRSEIENNYYKVEIEDNGIGINEKYTEQIFEMFKRLHSKPEYEGSGIGLSICKKIVELYNGNIHVESELGKGSTFIFKIPIKE